MQRVVGIDLASSAWTANGSAMLGFEPAADGFSELVTPAIEWPDAPLTPSALAGAIHAFVTRNGVRAVALDGPQGWRDPATPPGAPGVGRRCEWECRTQAKTGTVGHTYPGTQLAWVEFSIGVFDCLLSCPGVTLASSEGAVQESGVGYMILESFPTSAWKSSGLKPLPGKSRRPALSPFADALFATYRIPASSGDVGSHVNPLTVSHASPRRLTA
jgi:hypothetical protein